MAWVCLLPTTRKERPAITAATIAVLLKIADRPTPVLPERASSERRDAGTLST